MDAIKCICTRRSVRRFTGQSVSHEVIERLVELSAYAPTWKNTQTVRYTAVENREKLNFIAEECIMGFAGNRQTISNAPVLIVLTTVNGRSGYERDGSFSTSKDTHWQSFDAGIAAQTFCLAAHNLGLGTVIMGIYDEEKISAALQIPATESVSALIALGYPADIPTMPKRKSTEELLRFDEVNPEK